MSQIKKNDITRPLTCNHVRLGKGVMIYSELDIRVRYAKLGNGVIDIRVT